jgi:SAM-dependent methyltransferase
MSRSDYDRKYAEVEHFSYSVWLYRAFVRSLLRKAGVPAGSRVLDAGCGQGLMTHLLSEAGMEAVGVDLSAEGVRWAQAHYGGSRIQFIRGDVLELPFHREFDCVFVRGCSLYNSVDFRSDPATTAKLLNYLRSPGGVLIFDYHTNLSPAKSSPTWRYHSMDDLQAHFSMFPDRQLYFSTKLDTVILRSLALCKPVSRLNELLSRRLRVGGEAIAIVRV